MTSRGTRARAALFGLGLAVAMSAGGRGALAQTKAPSPEELKAAREMFQEAYKDEQEKRFAQALEKFQRVAAVKESASVRYRIGSVLEQLGRLREARDAFRALAASKPSLSTPEQEIADNAAERAHQLDRKIPKLVLRLAERSAAPTRACRSTARRSPRRRRRGASSSIRASTSSRRARRRSQPSENKVTLTEGGEVEFTVTLARRRPTVTPPPPTRRAPQQHARLRRARRRRRPARQRHCPPRGPRGRHLRHQERLRRERQLPELDEGRSPVEARSSPAFRAARHRARHRRSRRSWDRRLPAPPPFAEGRRAAERRRPHPPANGGLRVSTRPSPGGAMLGRRLGLLRPCDVSAAAQRLAVRASFAVALNGRWLRRPRSRRKRYSAGRSG